MNIHYTARQAELSEAQKKKLEAKFQKVQKILGNRHQPELHVVVSLERHIYVAEVTLHYRHHTLVVERSGTDLLGVALEAAEKLEKQLIRDKDKWRERKRRAKMPAGEAGGEAWTEVPVTNPGLVRVFRNGGPAGKPLTIEEAVMEMEHRDRDCVVYRDAEKGGISVLFRRRDGHLELVEA
jgi:putative sigma-54 modulation protein